MYQKATSSESFWNLKQVSWPVICVRDATHLLGLALQSQLNEAAGHKRKLVLESEGMLEAAKNEGEALARQVDILARSLEADPKATPSNEQRAKALDALLGLRRLEQLKAIAAGNGNSTYFFGDAKGTGHDSYEIDNVEAWKKSLRDPAHVETAAAPPPPPSSS